MPRYEMSDGKAHKFWEIEVDGNGFTVRYGRIGTSGQTSSKSFGDASTARAQADKLAASKVKKGYALVGKGGGRTAPSSPSIATKKDRNKRLSIEDALAANGDDLELWRAFGEQLDDLGDPRGELIALELQGETSKLKRRLKKHGAMLLGNLSEHTKTYDGEDTDAFTWKYGHVHGLRLSHFEEYGEGPEEGLAEAVLKPLLDAPIGHFLREITFVFNGDPHESSLQDLIDVLSKTKRPSIRKLHFGDFRYYGPYDKTATCDFEISWYSIGDLSRLWKCVPNLQTLITQGGASESARAGGVTFGKIALPELRHAEFRTGGLEQKNAKAILSAKIPSIERLDIWFGSEYYGGDSSAADVRPFLRRKDLPNLRRLGLKNAKFNGELIPLLAKSSLLKQLEALDLSMGCLAADNADVLFKHQKAFKHLDVLDLSKNYLGQDIAAELKETFPNIVLDGQRPASDFDDLDSRVVDVGE